VGFLNRGGTSKRRPSGPLETERRISRFQRLVEKHGELLDLFSDLEDKQTGEYILDRQYIEAQLDRAYEGGRRILYDMHVITGSDGGKGYEELDQIRGVSESILRERRLGGRTQGGLENREEIDWEILALREIHRLLTGGGRAGGFARGAGSGSPDTLSDWLEWAHAGAARWMSDRLCPLSTAPAVVLCDPGRQGGRIGVFPLGGLGRQREVLARCTERDPSLPDESVDLLPLRYFLEGLRGSYGSVVAKSGHGVRAGRKAADRFFDSPHLYVGEGWVWVRFPPSWSLRLLWCSLSVEESENLFYLFGAPLGSGEGTDLLWTGADRTLFRSYVSYLSDGSWICWASGFSWARGEERLRVLGHLFSEYLWGFGRDDAGQGGKRLVQQVLRTCLPDGWRGGSDSASREGDA
jgi:hypothetical protein